VIGLLASRWTRRHVRAARLVGRFCETPIWLRRRLAQTPYNSNRAQAARARRWMRQETAIRPNAESTPEFWKSERAEQERSPVTDEWDDRNYPRRSLSPRSCARPDSHLCESGDAIAERNSAQASRQMLRKRKSQQTRVCDSSNARTCSLRCDLLTASRLEFSPALSFYRIRHFISSHSARAVLGNSGLCRDGICDFGGITSIVGRAGRRAGASPWD
jgi:hypothetical protein